MEMIFYDILHIFLIFMEKMKEEKIIFVGVAHLAIAHKPN